MNQHRINTVSVIGLGYIGLPTAAMFASRRVMVVGVDVNQLAVNTINEGKIHIVEPELDIIVHAAVTEGFLRAVTKPEPADAFLIAVPTPFKGEHEPDLTYVRSAAESVAAVLKKGDIVILESTSPVGTTEQMAEWLSRVRPDLRFPVNGATEIDVNVAYCPERVLPGHVIRELVENDRIIGGLTPACSAKAAEIYRIFVRGELLFTNARTAEMCKLTENSFRDVNIAFANELSLISDKLGINVWELIKLANHHPRVHILQPGPGVGGHCIAVDPWFIVDSAPKESKLIHTARCVNDFKPEWVLTRIDNALSKIIQGGVKQPSQVRVALLGLAFKPNIDDLRESPAMRIAEQLNSRKECALLLVEPNIEQLPSSLDGHQLLALEDAISAADIVVILVAHNEFSGIRDVLKPQQHVIDVVGILNQ